MLFDAFAAMPGRSASFNSAVFLAACGLLTAGDAADGPSSLSDDPRCSPSLSVILDLENGAGGTLSRPLKNDGSFFHDGIDYPPEVRWTDGNITYGCICILRNCIRKCCSNNEVLQEDPKKEAICQRMPQNGIEPARAGAKTPDLRLSRDQMAEEIQHINELREHFLLVENNDCPNRTYTLPPDEFKENKGILQANGSIVNADGTIPFWNYCIDWQVTVNQIGVLVCLIEPSSNDNEDNEEKNTVHHVGIIISIPFLVATFLVYAITPELRNLYGKTLMCYVVCLIIAYIFLILVNYIHLSSIRAICITTGKQPPRVSANCNNQHFRNSQAADIRPIARDRKLAIQFK